MNLPKEVHMQNMQSLQESAIVCDLKQHPQKHLIHKFWQFSFFRRLSIHMMINPIRYILFIPQLFSKIRLRTANIFAWRFQIVSVSLQANGTRFFFFLISEKLKKCISFNLEVKIQKAPRCLWNL